MTPDVNLLVAAARSDHPHHAIARGWLKQAAAAAATGSAMTLMPMVVASFLRLVTSPRIFQNPTPVADAIAFVDALLAPEGVRLATPGPEWPRLRQLCVDKHLAGNDLPDAWLAAATIHLGEHFVSFDRDFKKLLGRAQLTLLEHTASRSA
jgi:toxin-antitoxin system PIN domain toxin